MKLDAARVGVESLNSPCVSARAPVLHCFAVVELRHVAQQRTGNVLALPAVMQENADRRCSRKEDFTNSEV